MAGRKKTTLVRMNFDTKQRLKKNFPDVKMPELLDIALSKSLLRGELWLRETDRKIFGNYDKKKVKKR